MVVCVGTPPFRRIALWVAMETMHLDIARIKKNSRYKFLGHDWGSNEQSNTHENLSWGSKVGQIISYGTSNMILIACFQRFFFIFRIFSPPKNTISPQIFFEDFFSIQQDTFLILKLLITFLKELVLGQGSFSAKCTGLFSYFGRKSPSDHFC